MSGEAEVEELPAELTLELEPQIEFKGGRYDALHLREPKVIEVRQAESHLRGNFGPEQLRKYQIALIAKVANVPEPVAEALPISKLNAAWKYLRGFIEPSQETGSSSSGS